ncbi:MAG: hypothetical protein M3Z13_03105 [Candidatus Dormibacteraeota bacterium]|nr:hypothetical protein [Candidatus Dormibacteraeota bacterium]
MDITSQVIQAINGWLQSLGQSVLGPALQAAGQLIFQTPAFDGLAPVKQSWAIARDVADALFVLALLLGGVLVMASGTFETEYSAKRLLPRLVLAAVLCNASLSICGALIRLDNALVTGLLGPDPSSSLWVQATAGLGRADLGGQVVASLLSLTAAILALLLVVVYIVRDLILLLGTVLAPMALAAYALPQTEELAELWWRIYCAGLLVQVCQAVLITVGAQLVAHTEWLGATSALVSGLVLVTLLYLLLKMPFLAYRWAFRQPVRKNRIVQVIAVAAKAAVA